MKSLKESVRAILSIRDEEKIVREFALSQFNERFDNSDGPVWFEGFEVQNKSTILVNYGYGEDMKDSFPVKI